MRTAIRIRGFTQATERSYVHWIRRYILHRRKQHPASLNEAHIRDFLSHLAVERNVAASTQNLALNAVIFLYCEVLETEVGDLGAIVRARQPKKLPVVLTRREVGALLRQMDGTPRLVALLLYGSGLRLSEALRLRVKDVDFDRLSLNVRRSKTEYGPYDHACIRGGGIPRNPARSDPRTARIRYHRRIRRRTAVRCAGTKVSERRDILAVAVRISQSNPITESTDRADMPTLHVAVNDSERP